jgi:translation elongation factor EF-Tu-like GTPase
MKRALAKTSVFFVVLKRDIDRGMVLAALVHAPHTKFKGTIYVLTKRGRPSQALLQRISPHLPPL